MEPNLPAFQWFLNVTPAPYLKFTLNVLLNTSEITVEAITTVIN